MCLTVSAIGRKYHTVNSWCILQCTLTWIAYCSASDCLLFWTACHIMVVTTLFDLGSFSKHPPNVLVVFMGWSVWCAVVVGCRHSQKNSWNRWWFYRSALPVFPSRYMYVNDWFVSCLLLPNFNVYFKRQASKRLLKKLRKVHSRMLSAPRSCLQEEERVGLQIPEFPYIIGSQALSTSKAAST